MTINIFMYIYIGENAHWDIYAPPPGKPLHKKKIAIFFIIFFHFRCILLQISHKKCFFISISILGRSGVNVLLNGTVLYIFKLVYVLTLKIVYSDTTGNFTFRLLCTTHW